MFKISEPDDILDALEDIFLRDGYRAVTYRSLATKLECSNRKIYEIAPSKEALFLKVISRFFSKVKKEGWRRAASANPLSDRIRDYLRVGIEAAERAGSSFNKDIASIESGRILFDEFQAERIGGLKELIEEGIASGEFAGFHAHLVAEVMMQSARRIRDPEFLLQSGMSFAEGLTELSRLIRVGLLAR